MPPLGPIRSDDGPACRVCGCTEHNACVTKTGAGSIACHWFALPETDNHRRLCSACAGTVGDALEVIVRVHRLMRSGRIDRARLVSEAFIVRLTPPQDSS